MSKTKFTPGPWHTRENDSMAYGDKLDHPLLICNKDWDIAILIADVEDIDYKANADLMTAAPDLYEALEWILGEIGKPEISAFGIEKCFDALAKARGE